MTGQVEQVYLRTEFLLLTPEVPAPDISLPTPVELTYSSQDPVVARLTFLTFGGPVVWEVDRDLLAEGLERPAGVGDVKVGPYGPTTLVVELSSPKGRAAFSVARDDIADFLEEVYEAVPRGREWDGVDVDAELLALIRDGAQ